MDEPKKDKKPSWLDRIDDKAEKKGLKTLWQTAKFVIVALIISLIQFILVNVLYFMMASWTTPLPGFLGAIFTEETVGEGHSNWGYILPFFLSNLIANTVSYFLNKSKTFKSDAPNWHYAIFFVVLVILILFSTWFQGVIANALSSAGATGIIPPTLAAMAAGMLQLVVLFPLQKFVLLKEKKAEKPAQ